MYWEFMFVDFLFLVAEAVSNFRCLLPYWRGELTFETYADALCLRLSFRAPRASRLTSLSDTPTVSAAVRHRPRMKYIVYICLFSSASNFIHQPWEGISDPCVAQASSSISSLSSAKLK